MDRDEVRRQRRQEYLQRKKEFKRKTWSFVIGITILFSAFLTFFVMQPTFEEIDLKAVVPFEAGTIDQDEFLQDSSYMIKYPVLQPYMLRRCFQTLPFAQMLEQVEDVYMTQLLHQLTHQL